MEGAFPLLEGLDLGFNYIGSESDVVVVVLFERLQRIILYGNPLAGPTGEDSLGLCVENLVEESDRYSDHCTSKLCACCVSGPRSDQIRGKNQRGDRCEGISRVGSDVLAASIGLQVVLLIPRLFGVASQIVEGGKR